MRRNAVGAVLPFLLFLLAALVFSPGCNGKGGDKDPEAERRLSLTEIGERALGTGEMLEEQGLHRGALEAYERAVWAFVYHERLTGTAPLLLDDARENLTRLRQKPESKNPPK